MDNQPEESTAVEFDISNLPVLEHEWVQEGNQPTLRCVIEGHHHTAAIRRGLHAMPDKDGRMVLREA